MNLATRWIDRGAVAFTVPTAFGAGSFPGGPERAPRALVEGHLEGRFVERAKVSRREAGLRADKRWGASTGVGMGAAQQRVAADERDLLWTGGAAARHHPMAVLNNGCGRHEGTSCHHAFGSAVAPAAAELGVMRTQVEPP